MQLLHNAWVKGASLLTLLRLQPFDTASEAGRSDERLRRAMLTAASAVFARIVSIAGPLVTVPLTLAYLGRERYGLWMAVTSFIGMFAFADLGLGNGLMTELSQADGRDDPEESRRCIASCLFALSVVSLLLLGVYLVVYSWIPWPNLLNSTSPGLWRETGAVVTVCFVAFLMNLPLGVVQRAQWGVQEGFRCNLWQCAGSLINIVVVLLAVKSKAALPVLVLGVAGVQPLVNLLNTCVFFGAQRPNLRPRWEHVQWATARRLLCTGLWFFLYSVLVAFGLYSDNLIIAHVLGLKVVPLYSVPSSLAVYLGAVASMLYTPFWTANGEALARGDLEWVRSTTFRIVKFNVVITGAAGLGFVVAGPIFLHAWISPDFTPGRLVFAGMAAWAFLTSTMGPVFMILNGANAVRVQVLIFGVFSVISVLLKLVLAHRIGIAGVVWASVLPYACLVVPATLWVTRDLFQRAREKCGNAHPPDELRLRPCKQAVTAPQG